MQYTAEIKEMFEAFDTSKDKDVQADKPDRDLFDGIEGQTYIVRKIRTEDDEMNAFLFRLGCYSGEPITIISRKKKSCIVAIKDSRYNLDKQLCEAIII